MFTQRTKDIGIFFGLTADFYQLENGDRGVCWDETPKDFKEQLRKEALKKIELRFPRNRAAVQCTSKFAAQF